MNEASRLTTAVGPIEAGEELDDISPDDEDVAALIQPPAPASGSSSFCGWPASPSTVHSACSDSLRVAAISGLGEAVSGPFDSAAGEVNDTKSSRWAVALQADDEAAAPVPICMPACGEEEGVEVMRNKFFAKKKLKSLHKLGVKRLSIGTSSLSHAQAKMSFDLGRMGISSELK
ncbi:unnamed protein product [Protopolystoma xenopodis]|uniref:Uncharacterized protein n=1 Tax=Protopolystoma xenopodis TaxID=117903 RepID=A0A448WTQ7_9PLAT|nr:unnamed protein product [Protopolystoma xenopodis]